MEERRGGGGKRVVSVCVREREGGGGLASGTKLHSTSIDSCQVAGGREVVSVFVTATKRVQELKTALAVLGTARRGFRI